MIRIIGDQVLPEAQAFYDVRDALSFEQDVILLAHAAPVFGVTLKDVAIYNMEPLYDGCRSFSAGYLEILKRCHVLDYSARNVAYLKTLGIEAFHMPYGFHKSLCRVTSNYKDIDVLLVGSINPRRSEILSNLDKEFSFAWVQGVYGSERDRLISRARVHLNVHYSDSHALEVVRLNYLMANHCTVVSEKGNEAEVNKVYSDGLYFTDYDNIIESCLDALDSPKDGYDCIRQMPHSCVKAQEWLNTR